MKRPSFWLLMVGLVLLWPLLHLLVFVLRFNHLPPGGWQEAAQFLPMSIVAAAVFGWFWLRADTRTAQLTILLGYLLAAPIAFIGALGGGLILPPLLSVLLCGALPLVLGSAGAALLAQRRA